MDDNKDIQNAYDAKMDTRAFSRVYKTDLKFQIEIWSKYFQN